jgi:hypothetical protein
MLSTIKKHIYGKNGKEAHISNESVEKLVLTFMSNCKKELECILNQHQQEPSDSSLNHSNIAQYQIQGNNQIPAEKEGEHESKILL